MIQTAVDAYYTKNNATFPVNGTVQLNIIDPTTFTKSQFTTNGDDISSNSIVLYEIDYDLIKIDSLKYGRKQNGINDVYVLSKNSGKVYYAKGLEIGGNIYYTLTEDINNLLSYNRNKNTVNSPIVLFEPSTTEWTSSDVTIRIKVPTIIESINSVKIINEDGSQTLLTSQSEEDGYYIYQATPIGNYTAEVNYKLKASDLDTKVAKYSVTNVDKLAPSINVDITNKVKIDLDDYVGYLRISSNFDNLSGVKTIKYDFGDYINSYTKDKIKTHFEVASIEAKDDAIFVKSGCDKITVYIEDNAGNFYAELIDTTDILEVASPVIPNGFKYLEGTIENGFVIKNKTDGNEFVWVPVEEGTFKRESFGTDLSEYSEPYSTTDYTSEKAEYDAMVASVEKYGGFYMGRYEASKKTVDGVDIAQCIQEEQPWIDIAWGESMTNPGENGAVGKARAVYPAKDATAEGDAVSTLTYGIQWDATVRWIRDSKEEYKNITNDSTGFGNYSDVSNNETIPTGSKSSYALNNIYDMAGNVLEWTMESFSSIRRFCRGGYYGCPGDNYPISFRPQPCSPDESFAYTGFRLALYVK